VKTSPDGALLMSGKGVEATKERIAKAFEDARDAGATSLVLSKPKPGRIKIEKPQRTLQEKAAPLLREIRVPVAHRRTGLSWEIEEPVVRDVSSLFDECLAALGFAPKA
jgi:hypothetical protein